MVIEEVIRGIVIVRVRGVLVFMDVSGTEDIISTMETNIMKGVGMKDITTKVREVTTIKAMTTEEVTDIRSMVIHIIIHGEERSHHMQVQRDIFQLPTALHQWRIKICHNLPVLGVVE